MRSLHTRFIALALAATALAATALAAIALPLGAQATGKPPATSANASYTLLGSWRVQRGVVAPWVKDKAYHPDTRAWLGKTIRFDAQRVIGVNPLGCAQAHYEPTRMPPDMLFQGGLLAPAKPAALELGFKTFPVIGTSFTCDKGLFEFHYADEQAVLVAVDNVIWTLDRSAGARADSASPAGVVQRLLEHHFAGDMGFDVKSMAAKQAYVSDALRARIAQYLKRPSDPNEAPVIDGDPFTDSQEYPTRFSVGVPVAEGALMLVPVRFSDAYSSKTVRYVMQRAGASWRVSDIRYGKGESTFWTLLR